MFAAGLDLPDRPIKIADVVQRRRVVGGVIAHPRTNGTEFPCETSKGLTKFHTRGNRLRSVGRV